MAETNPTDQYDSLSAEPLPGIEEPSDNGASDRGPSRLAGQTDAAPAAGQEQSAQLAEQRNLYLRTLADFDNYRKRIDRQVAERSQQGRREVLIRLLPVLDNLQRAADLREQGTPADKIVDGLLATVRQFVAALEAENVRPIDVKGRPFDPALGEAVSARYEPNMPENTVVEEARKGYMLGDDVLRPAQVIVSKADE